MIDLLIPIIVFAISVAASVVFIGKYRKHQISIDALKTSHWNNQYIFESIPSVFPTLGILLTALGITIGIWNFDTTDIQNSIPHLLGGLKLAFIATMLGIICLITFQKYVAIVQKQIDDSPNKPRKQTDELSAISELTFAVTELKHDNQKQIEKLIQSFSADLETKVSVKISSLETEIIKLHKNANETQKITFDGLNKVIATTDNTRLDITEQLKSLRDEQKSAAEKAIQFADETTKAIAESSKLTLTKFDEFSELLRKNNTEALVEVMKGVTEQFNTQMGELINRLVKENFEELNSSVNNLNEWQRQNKEQIHKLTEQFQSTSEMFHTSATTLRDVAANTKELTADNGKLSQLVKELQRVLIEDGKFQEITSKLTATIEKLSNTSEHFEETTSKLNDWVKTEKNFKEAAQILISKLEEFRDLNGDVWEKYRKEMSQAVSIVKETSSNLSEDLENINAEFYGRLNDTLQNLDQCIQRFVPVNAR